MKLISALRGRVVSFCLLFFAGSIAHGAPITFGGDSAGSTEGLGNYIATLSYNASSGSSATLGITLKNTSSLANGGFITAFVFNNPGDAILTATMTSSDADFGILGDPGFNNGINGQPFGDFDIGASTGGSFEGGGPPSQGIPVGTTTTFTFTLTGTGLDLLDELDFFNTQSSPQGNSGTASFVVRFRGFLDGGSDKVPAGELGDPDDDGDDDDDPDPPPVIPEPASALILGMGLIGVAGLRRLRRTPRAKS